VQSKDCCYCFPTTVKRLLLLLSYNSQKTAAAVHCCCCHTVVKRLLLLSYSRDAVRTVLFTTKQRCCPPHEDHMTYSIKSFLLTLTKFSLERHVLPDSVFHESPDWVRMNAVVRTWLLGTLSDALADIVSQRGASARTLWPSIESQFLGNCTTRALYADQEFRSFSHGDLPVAEYCRRYKKLAEDLRDLGEPVSDRTLVLNIVRGLNERFQALGLHLRRTHTLPSFLQVRDDLALEELTMAKVAPAAALATLPNTGSSSGSQSSQPCPPSPNQQQQTGGRGGGGSFQHRGKRGMHGGQTFGGNRGAPPVGSSQVPTPPGGHSYYNPWGLVWKLKSPSGLKGIGEEISSFPPQSPPIPKGI
jgi:hypothetical protein